MVVAYVLAALVGLSIVVQGGINAQLGRSINLYVLLAVGNSVCAALSLGVFAVTHGGGLAGELARLPLRVLIPSVCGFVITAGMPTAIARVGAPNAISVLIAVQLLASLAWERLSGGHALTPTRLAGAALLFLGALLVVRS